MHDDDLNSSFAEFLNGGCKSLSERVLRKPSTGEAFFNRLGADLNWANSHSGPGEMTQGSGTEFWRR